MRRRPSSSCAEALEKRSGNRKPGTRTIESGVTSPRLGHLWPLVASCLFNNENLKYFLTTRHRLAN